MAAEGREYYVALAFAAAVHGASTPPLAALKVMVAFQQRPELHGTFVTGDHY